MSSELEIAIERIERAFADVRLENGVSIREADVIDDYGTPEQRGAARAQDEKNDWRQIPEELIARYDWSLSFFDAKGMRFHLPAYMIYTLRNYKGGTMSVDSTIYTLGRESPQFSLFTPPQKAAVRRFLRFMITYSSLAKHARQALDQVWMKGLHKGEQKRGA